MMTKHTPAALCVLTLALAAPAQPQAPSGPPKPGPEHKKLEYYVGRWAVEGDMKPSPLGPGGKMTGSENCEWFAGGFHLVCRSDGKGPMGEIKGMGVLTYNAENKVYTYNGIDNMGSSDSGTGAVEGDTWTWNGETKTGGKLMKSRYTIKQLSQDAYTFKFEMSVDGGPWATVMEGKETRAK